MANVIALNTKTGTRLQKFAANVAEVRAFKDDLSTFLNDNEQSIPTNELICLQQLLIDCSNALEERSPNRLRSVLVRKDLFTQFQAKQAR